MRTLLIDNYDSYTYNLFHLIAETLGVEPTVRTNDAREWETGGLDGFDAIVVSPGPGRPQVRQDVGACLDVVRATELPVLGVCLGHQALGWLAGARVEPAPTARHGHVDRIRHTGRDLFEGLPREFTAVRYHSLCVVPPLPAELEATAWAADGVVMALRHSRRPWWGVQFHPESVATEHGARLVENFARLAGVRGRRPARQARAPRRSSIEPAARWSLRVRVVDRAVDAERVFRDRFDHDHAFWLDSSRVAPGLARFSFAGDAGGPYGEILRYRVGSGAVDVRGTCGGAERRTGSIFDVLDQRLQARRVAPRPDLPFDLAGGYVGYLGYELKADCGSPNRHVSPLPDAVWMAATRLVAVDHDAGRTWAVALVGGEDDAAADAWLEETAELLATLPAAPRDEAITPPNELDPEPWLVRPRAGYSADVEECKRLLRAGESYEICLTNTVELPFSGDPFETYRRLRRLNAAPYSAYLRLGETHVLCSSPERFLKVDRDRIAESKPIKGTSARDDDPAADRASMERLASSSKNRAENLMIVDLVRNDLGRVCEVGTVSVPGFMEIESYATVHQLVSTVRGRLREDVTAVEAARACFPGGSMTGAPKLRTMEIIDRLETRPRGVYSGAIGFFGPTGAADLNLVIRTAVVDAGTVTVGAGGAIVLDSDPDDEFEELLLKARAVTRALPVPAPASVRARTLSASRG